MCVCVYGVCVSVCVCVCVHVCGVWCDVCVCVCVCVCGVCVRVCVCVCVCFSLFAECLSGGRGYCVDIATNSFHLTDCTIDICISKK